MVTGKVDESIIVIETEQTKVEDNSSSVEREKKSKVENKEFYRNMFKAKVAKSKAKEAMFSNPEESHRQAFDANLEHSDDYNGTALWSAGESNEALRDDCNQ